MLLERVSLFFRYWKNNRIKEYNEILSLAKDSGYQMISMEQYVFQHFDSTKKLLILRHDVDHISMAPALMLAAEKSHGAKASYYFRECTADYQLMKDIEKAGGEASFHFETIANFMQVHHISDRQELLGSDFQAACEKLLCAELDRFRVLYDVSCHTIASHGEFLNSVACVSNNVLTENVESYQQYGILLEAYNKKFIDGLGIYISDVPMEINGGYNYGIHPSTAIRQGISPILFLSHPNHWQYSHWQQFRKMAKMILRAPVHQKNTFKRIAL